MLGRKCWKCWKNRFSKGGRGAKCMKCERNKVGAIDDGDEKPVRFGATRCISLSCLEGEGVFRDQQGCLQCPRNTFSSGGKTAKCKMQIMPKVSNTVLYLQLRIYLFRAPSHVREQFYISSRTLNDKPFIPQVSPPSFLPY